MNRLAKFIVDVTTGQIEDRQPTPEERGKDPTAVALGRKRGQAHPRTTAAPGLQSRQNPLG